MTMGSWICEVGRRHKTYHRLRFGVAVARCIVDAHASGRGDVVMASEAPSTGFGRAQVA